MNKDVSTCEEQTLMAIYKADEAPDLSEVMESVNTMFNHAWKPQTVSTFLTRLVKKGYLTSERKGRYCYYYPTIALDKYREDIIRKTASTFFNGSIQEMKNFIENM